LNLNLSLNLKMITQKTIQDVMNIARVEEVIGDFINLRRRGVNMIGNCPFHDEKTPSFTVSPSKNIYKCFGCGKGGDSVRFIMDHEKISFPESIRFLANRYNITIEETVSTTENIEQKLITDSLYIVNEFARDHFTDTLFNRAEGKNIGLSYFKERGFREATIKKFELGYATEDRDEFTKKAIDKKFNIEHLRSLGLTSKSDLDFFRARVMFTIHNVSGKVIAFAGRTLSSDKKQPKYINSPESEIYNKRAVLYGLYFAKDAIRKEDECILVEGYTDVITLHQGKIENVVASSGTSLTKEQIGLIKRHTKNIKIIYDGDAAGIKAALRGLDLVLESDMNVKLVLLPDGQDPDSFLAAQGTEAFQAFLKDNEEDFLFFKTRILLEETSNDPIKKSLAIRDIVSSIAKVQETFKRTLYIRQCASMLDLSDEVLNSEVNKVLKEGFKRKQQEDDRQNGSQQPPYALDEEAWLNPKPILSTDQVELVKNDAHQERAVCSILVNYGDKVYDEQGQILAQFMVDTLESLMDEFDIELYKKIITVTKEQLKEQNTISGAYYTSHPDEEVRKFAVDAMSSPYIYADWAKKEITLQTQKMPDENYVRDATNALKRLQLRKSKRVIRQVQTYLDKATPVERESEEYMLNLKVLQVLLKERNELAAELGTVTL
ncbi:MAG TPA: DNA primase, partial [Saprospiraceae bacterium]|nr:DNA primase [Saprospiraceae bacterium]